MIGVKLGRVAEDGTRAVWQDFLCLNRRVQRAKQRVFVLLVSLCLGVPQNGDCSPAMVFLLSGQSNMTGVGLLSELPANEWVNPGTVRLLAACDTGPLFDSDNPKNGCITGRFGPELGISERLAAAFPNQKIVLIKLSLSGASLQQLQTSNLGWFLSDTYYKNWFLPKLTDAFSKLSDPSRYPDGYQLSGIFWMQGESDATEAATAQYGKYSAALKSFVDTKLRVELAKRNGIQPASLKIPFVYSQISSNWEHYPAIQREQRLAQSLIAKSSCITAGKYAQRYPYPGVVQGCAPCEPNHYNWVGQLELGRAFGRAMVDLLSGGAPQTCPNEFRPFLVGNS